MSRGKEAPLGFVCPYRHCCPEVQGLSAAWMFEAYQRFCTQEREYWRLRDDLVAEISGLESELRAQRAENDQLRAENKRLHQSRFKPRRNKAGKKSRDSANTGKQPTGDAPSGKVPKQRGAPAGHPPWSREVPDRVDRTVHVEAPCSCPHCDAATDPSRNATTSYTQEDIVLRPQTVVTSFVHQTAWCPGCRRQVFKRLEGELPFAPIGPKAKAAALYLRHEIKLPYRKVKQAMGTLFGLDFATASSLGFEKRAHKNGVSIYRELIEKMRHCDLVHADETYWRQDGENVFVWYAGNQSLAVFRIDPHRSTEAAKRLLGERIDGLLVTDAYAAYNAIQTEGRQSCLAHLLRAADEIGKVLAAMKAPDTASQRFCRQLKKLFKEACAVEIPASAKGRSKLTARLMLTLDKICARPLGYAKAETLRKRLIPGAREYNEVFAFIRFGGPPTNNHAERALRPLVIFRKVCLGTRSQQGSENIAVFNSLTQTAKLQECPALELFEALLTGTPAAGHDLLFNNSS